MIYINDLIRGLGRGSAEAPAGSIACWQRDDVVGRVAQGAQSLAFRPSRGFERARPNRRACSAITASYGPGPQGYLDRPNAPRKFAAPSGFLLRGANRIDMRTALVKLRGENRRFGAPTCLSRHSRFIR
jgi:hypothetical protein